MTRTRPAAHVLLAILLVVGAVAPAAATPGDVRRTATDRAPTYESAASPSDANALPSDTNNSSVNVTVGRQLSTVLTATSDEVQTEYESTAFEMSYERADREERVEVLAERARRLRDRAEAIENEYENATAAYEAGDISKSEYAQRLAALAARAKNVRESYASVENRTERVSELDLRVAGLNRTEFAAAISDLDGVSGPGATALLARFTGASDGEVELETDGGLSISVENDGGEQTREFERRRDGDDAITVPQSAAYETARNALSSPDNGSWSLQKAGVHTDSGYYKFEFRLRSNASTGEAEVRVDGSTGDVFRLESEIGADDSKASDEGERESELTLVVARGTPAPNATVTVRALANGTPISDAAVFLDGTRAGTTDANGTLTVTLPSDGATLAARAGESEAELEFEFEREDDENETLYRRFDADATLDGDSATVTVTYDGSGVANATVYANGDRAGETSAAGTVSFAVPSDAEELELEVVKGEFEAELAYELVNGSLSLTEGAHDGDGDKAGKEDGDDEDEPEESDDDGEADDEGETADDDDEDEHETETTEDDDTETTEEDDDDN